MKFIVEYWDIILIAIATLLVLAVLIISFIKEPRSEQIAKLKEWLLFAVAKAEQELGSGTGKLKLRYVYDMFVSKFPFLVKVVSFEYFSELVDEVLVKFREILDSNTSIKQYIEGT